MDAVRRPPRSGFRRDVEQRPAHRRAAEPSGGGQYLGSSARNLLRFARARLPGPYRTEPSRTAAASAVVMTVTRAEIAIFSMPKWPNLVYSARHYSAVSSLTYRLFGCFARFPVRPVRVQPMAESLCQKHRKRASLQPKSSMCHLKKARTYEALSFLSSELTARVFLAFKRPAGHLDAGDQRLSEVISCEDR